MVFQNKIVFGFSRSLLLQSSSNQSSLENAFFGCFKHRNLQINPVWANENLAGIGLQDQARKNGSPSQGYYWHSYMKRQKIFFC